MRTILSLFPWHRRGLRPYDKAVLDSLKSVVSPQAWAAVQEQISAISTTHDVTGKDISFAFDQRQHVTKWLLPSPLTECPMAVARCRGPNRAAVIRATVWVDSAGLCSITYSERPERIGNNQLAQWRSELIFDPFDATWRDFGATSERPDVAQARIPLQELIARIGVKAMRAPLNAVLRNAFLLPVRDCLPLDYVELLPYTNAFQFNGWNFTGLPLLEVTMDGPNQFVLAESSEQPIQLHAVDGDSARKVYLFDLEDDEARCLGDSFLAALEIDLRKN